MNLPAAVQTQDGVAVALAVQNVSKLYKVYSHPKDLLIEAVTRKVRHHEHWALRDVSFSAGRGEVVGIIGPNGAGKSTLLKIITGTLTPTSGKVLVNGRVSAILELGTGFHPEYTGRQNVITGGMCLGMTRKQVEAKLPWILEFSELEPVIDLPFKTYSSGMQARLTFATAISVEPELFIVDEALSAGDAYFIHKCMRRVREICDSGATVLFVSHSEGLVAELCDRAIWIQDGRVLMSGEAEPVAKAYIKSVWDRQELQNLSATGEMSESLKATGKSGKYTLGGDALRIVSVDVVDADGNPIGHVTSGDDLRIRIQWEGETQHPNIYASMRLDSGRIQAVAAVEGYDVGAYLDRDGPLTRRGAITYCIPKVALGEGMYWVSTTLCRHMIPKSTDAILHYIEKACQFTVGRNSLWHFSVVYDPKFEWTIEKVPDAPLLNSGGARTDPWRERLKAFFDVRSQAVDQAVEGVPTVQDLCFIAGREPRIWCEPAMQEDLACSILTALNVDVQSTVLEVGSAAGFLAKLVAPHVGSFVGVDLSEDSLDVARRLRLPNARFLQADGGALPFPDESFDGVFCYDVFTNFPNFLDGESLIREMIRVVKRGKRALAGSIPDLSKTAEIAARFAEVTKELEARYGPLPDRTASVAAATSNSPVRPEVVCYYFAKGDFRALGERLGVETSIAEVHPLNPYYGMRFDVIFTRR